VPDAIILKVYALFGQMRYTERDNIYTTRGTMRTIKKIGEETLCGVMVRHAHTQNYISKTLEDKIKYIPLFFALRSLLCRVYLIAYSEVE
jgi:hypothetical protein